MDREVIPKQLGFSLLELVVVVAVISVLSITVVFSVGRSDEPVLNDAARFQAEFERLRNAAVFSHSRRAIALTKEGWQALQRAPENDESIGGWMPVGQAHRFKGEARFRGQNGTFEYGLREAELAPDLVFLPDGQVTPFEVSFISPDLTTRCENSGWAGLSCER